MSTDPTLSDDAIAAPQLRLQKPEVLGDGRYPISSRTIRNYVAKGYLKGYKIPSYSGLLIDVDELEALMDRMPRSKGKASRTAYGPKAQIITLGGQK